MLTSFLQSRKYKYLYSEFKGMIVGGGFAHLQIRTA